MSVTAETAVPHQSRDALLIGGVMREASQPAASLSAARLYSIWHEQHPPPARPLIILRQPTAVENQADGDSQPDERNPTPFPRVGPFGAGPPNRLDCRIEYDVVCLQTPIRGRGPPVHAKQP